jgi:hypothetical protein
MTGRMRSDHIVLFARRNRQPLLSPAVGCNQDLSCRRIKPFAFLAPPSPAGCHRKRSGVVIGPDIDKPCVAPDVVDAIGIGTRHVGCRKIVTANLPRPFCWKALLAEGRYAAERQYGLAFRRQVGVKPRGATRKGPNRLLATHYAERLAIHT